MSLGVELNSLVFKFFWGGKRDLVARRVVVQPRSLGGFAVVDFFSKVSALHVQWVSRFLVSPSSWVSFMVFWFSSVLGSPPHAVFSAPGAFALGGLPRLYCSLVSSWVVCRESLWASGFGIGSGIFSCPVESLSCKSAYWFLLSELVVSPHWVEKFFPLFGSLYWSATWRQLFLFDLDRPVIDLSWKVAHGVLYTAERMSSFGYDIPLSCFCSAPCESLQHLFFDCPLAVSVLSWLQSLLFCASLLSPSILVRHVLLASLATSCVSSLVSLCTFSTFVSFVFGGPVMTSASAVSVRLLLTSWIVSRLVSASISRCSSVAFPPIVAAVFSSVSGVLVVILLQSSMAVSSFIFSLLFGIPVLCAGLVGRLVTLGSAIC